MIRDAEWCEAERDAGRKIRGERIHLHRLLRGTGWNIQGCKITSEPSVLQDGFWPVEGNVPEHFEVSVRPD